jgi:hypothetical protein
MQVRAPGENDSNTAHKVYVKYMFPEIRPEELPNAQARTVRDGLLAIDDLILEGPDCQDPYGGQDPYDESMKLLAIAVDDEPIDGGLEDDSDVISSLQSHENRSQSLHITPSTGGGTIC